MSAGGAYEHTPDGGADAERLVAQPMHEMAGATMARIVARMEVFVGAA